MAARLIWSPEAVEDIEAIARFIERDSPRYAQIVVSRLVETARSIPAFPYIGRLVPEFDRPDLRERLTDQYRVIYRVESMTILVIAVVHGSRLLENLPGRFV